MADWRPRSCFFRDTPGRDSPLFLFRGGGHLLARVMGERLFGFLPFFSRPPFSRVALLCRRLPNAQTCCTRLLCPNLETAKLEVKTAKLEGESARHNDMVLYKRLARALI